MEPLIVLTRSNLIESIHYGTICVVNTSNKIIASLGEASEKTYTRSIAKPFQAIAMVHSGAVDHYNITQEELAVMCSSHSGQKYHQELVQSILQKVGLSEGDLDCGSMLPYNPAAKNSLIREGKKPAPIYNSCSGKHAGMLMLCKYKNYPTLGYINKDHPVQKLMLGVIAELLECSPSDILLGTDGCGVPNYMLTLQQSAYLYAQLAGVDINSKYGAATVRIREAMAEYPRAINGDEEFCSDIIHYTRGKIIGKVGAEGVYGLSLVEQKLGIVIKVIDGTERALYPAAIEAARQFGAIDKDTVKDLKTWAIPPVKNHRGETVGYTIPVFDLTNPKTNNAVTIGQYYNQTDFKHP